MHPSGFKTKEEYATYMRAYRKQSLHKKLTLAYLAGIVDGEGSIGIIRGNRERKNSPHECNYRLNFCVSMTDQRALEIFASTFGGNVNYHKVRGKNNSPIYSYAISDKKLKPLLIALEPYLVLKKRNAQIGLEYLKYEHNAPRQALSDEEFKRRTRLYCEMCSLNFRKKRISHLDKNDDLTLQALSSF